MGAATGQIVAAGIGAGASLFGASKQSSSANRAAQLQAQATREALDFARQQAEEERRREEEEQRRLDEAWRQDQAWRAPYRAASLSILGGYGFDVPRTMEGGRPRPEGWRPEDTAWSQADFTQIDETGFGSIGRRTPTASGSIGSMMRRPW